MRLMKNLPDTSLQDLQALLEQIRPEQFLLLHPVDQSLSPGLQDLSDSLQVDTFTEDQRPESLKHLKIYDLVVLEGFETLTRNAARQLISRIRDFHARHFFLLVDTQAMQQESSWSNNDFIALGLRLFRDYKDEGELVIYRFELSDYKTTPEWLNSRYWANPELYDKYRW